MGSEQSDSRSAVRAVEPRRAVHVQRGRWRSLEDVYAEIEVVRELRDERLAEGSLRHAGGLCEDMERLQGEYATLRGLVRPPL